MSATPSVHAIASRMAAIAVSPRDPIHMDEYTCRVNFMDEMDTRTMGIENQTSESRAENSTDMASVRYKNGLMNRLGRDEVLRMDPHTGARVRVEFTRWMGEVDMQATTNAVSMPSIVTGGEPATFVNARM